MRMLFPSLFYLLVFDHVARHRYAYSLVFASDMYATVFKKAPLDPKLGKLYRDKILLVAGSRDATDSLKDFLGREPNPKAFIDEINDRFLRDLLTAGRPNLVSPSASTISRDVQASFQAFQQRIGELLQAWIRHDLGHWRILRQSFVVVHRRESVLLKITSQTCSSQGHLGHREGQTLRVVRVGVGVGVRCQTHGVTRDEP